MRLKLALAFAMAYRPKLNERGGPGVLPMTSGLDAPFMAGACAKPLLRT
jgi:hypothetical protein